jgi:predicted O-methyltransferase YrrM
MDNHLREFLRQLYEEGRSNDERETDRSKKMLNLEPDTAQLISMLIQMSHRKRILEIGTSNGYSTIWLAWAAQAGGGEVISIDRDERKQMLAKKNLRRAQLRHLVTLLCGDATDIVASLSGPFDCVFFDADRVSAPSQLQILVPKLTPDALILADNVHSHPDEIAAYLAALEAFPQFEKLVVPVGKGLSIAYAVLEKLL